LYYPHQLAEQFRYLTVSSTKISLLTVSVNSKNNSKTSNKQQKEKTDRREILSEPTVLPGSIVELGAYASGGAS
jgi:hypothetical protein